MPEPLTMAERLEAIGRKYGFVLDPDRIDAHRASLALGHREDFCSCIKETGEYGEHGMHWRVNPADPSRKQADTMVGRCDRYAAAKAEAEARTAGVASPDELLLQKAGVPPAYLHCSLETWRGVIPEAVETYSRQVIGNLLILGSPGRGKTHLATGVALAALRRSRTVAWRSVPEILAGSRKGDWGWCDKQLQALQDAYVAVLDDLGGERGTEYDLSAIAEVVHLRHAQQRPTLATTNLTLEQLQKRDGRIASRLASGSVVELGGRDRRLTAEIPR